MTQPKLQCKRCIEMETLRCPSLGRECIAKLSLRRESAIVESKPVGHGVLLVVVPCQLFLASRAEHDRIIPLSEANGSYIARGAPFAKLRSR